MEIGKIPNSILKELIIDKISSNRNEVLIRPKIGEDCSAVDLEGDVCVLSSDPITGAASEIGSLSVYISCNDIASCGAEPIGLLITILAPSGTSKEEVALVMNQINNTASLLNVDIIGGHTEITTAVNRFVVISTAIGKVKKDKLVTTSGAKVGNDIVLTKSAGLEGTAIIASDKEDELLNIIGKNTVDRAKAFIDSISVIKEGIIAGEFGVNAMHDITEGGVLGAIWELAEASQKGAVVYKDKIPVEPETLEISKVYNIDPLRLISSGSMLIACEDGEGLVKKLLKNGVKASVIGKISDNMERILVLGDKRESICEPESDELYKVIK